MIHNVDPQFSQWDVGRIVSISDSDATHIHFANQGDSKAVIMEITEGSVKVPDYLLQTGKNVIAYAVKDGVTLESKSFPVRKRERPENYIYEDDKRNYFYALLSDAKVAIEKATEAAEKSLYAVLYKPQTLTPEQQGQALDNIGVTFFGVPYSSAEEVIDLSEFVKMYLFATADGYDAVVDGEGAIPNHTLTTIQTISNIIETVNRPFDGEKVNRLHICEGITSIGDYFMYKAYNLKHLSFADSTKITHLGKKAFAVTAISGEYNFSGLTDTTVDCVFQYCPKLEGIAFGGNIKTIITRSFRGCISLRYVKNITKSGTTLTINDAAFWYCTSLKSIDVEPVNTVLCNWVFMFAPTDAKTESGIELASASWKAQGDMCFVQNEWTNAQLTAIKSIKGDKTIQFAIPESDTQSDDFNIQYGVIPYEDPVDGKYKPRIATADGLCGLFSLFHIYNIMYPNKQFDTFYDFIERCIVPNKIEVTQEVYNALVHKGDNYLADMSEYVSYEVGSKISAIDLPINLGDSSTYGDTGTAFWGFCEALGWTATEFVFDNADDCGAKGKQLVFDSLASGKPVVMEVVGAGGSVHGGHAVVSIGYDSKTDEFLIIDSTGAFPSDVVPLLYWVKFESMITPDSASAIWTFNFGEEITMTHVDEKLNDLLETVNSGFHSVSGRFELTNDVPSAGNTVASMYRVECPSNAKIFVLTADENTAAAIKTKADKYYTLGVNCNFTNGTSENDRPCMTTLWVGNLSKKTYGNLSATNDDGVSFSSYTMAAGTYRWTAYYWND